jgi:hypothetical protein
VVTVSALEMYLADEQVYITLPYPYCFHSVTGSSYTSSVVRITSTGQVWGHGFDAENP